MEPSDSDAAGTSPGCQTTRRSREPANNRVTKFDELPSQRRANPKSATDSAVANRTRCPVNHRPRGVELCVPGRDLLGARRCIRCTMNPDKAEAIAQHTMLHCTVASTLCVAGASTYRTRINSNTETININCMTRTVRIAGFMSLSICKLDLRIIPHAEILAAYGSARHEVKDSDVPA